MRQPFFKRRSHIGPAPASGVETKMISEVLGHSNTAITLDTYSAVLAELKLAAADHLAQQISDAPKDDTDQEITDQTDPVPTGD